MQENNRPLTLALSHPMREQLADTVMGLPGITVLTEASAKVNANAALWKKLDMYASFEQHLKPFQKKTLALRLQQSLGIVNCRFFDYFSDKSKADAIFANGGFLITKKPYIIYIEKATQLFSYTARVYRTPIAIAMLTYFLEDDNLRLVLFRTETAREGFYSTYRRFPRIIAALQKKSTWLYPPDANTQKIDLNRFKDETVKKKGMHFLFIHSSFISRGGYQLVRAFARVSKKYPDAKLTLITKETTIDAESRKIIDNNPNIILQDAVPRKELYNRFYNQAHCYIHPTYDDSFSMNINEAISAGLPVIASDFFSIPERVTNNVSGFLFKSPYPNYTTDFRIISEHFGDEPTFVKTIYEDSRTGKLQYVEDFLAEKMTALLSQKGLLLKMAMATKKTYDEHLAICKDKKTIAAGFKKALSAKQ